MKGYTTREVADVLGLPTSRILSWTRRGLLTPERGAGGAYLYSFQDIVLLRTARELLDAKVPTRRVREALEALRKQLPVGRPLSAVRVSAVGDRVLVREDDSVWEPDSGQIQMDFSVADVAAQAEPIARRALASADVSTMAADDWYDSALDLEAVALDQAATAYRHALALDAHHAEAHLNLGRLLHEGGELAEARSHYFAAVESDPESARARYNLGVVLEDMGDRKDAITAYEAALALDDRLATAHFNLSRLFEADGREADALQHLVAYKRLVEVVRSGP
jgi:tetratricopeptide (TPR) repeat protein